MSGQRNKPTLQIKQVWTVLFGNRSITRCKPQSYKCQIRNRPNLFLEKIKKNPKKFRLKAVVGGLVYHTGGGCTLGGLQIAIFTHATNGARVTIPNPNPVRAKVKKTGVDWGCIFSIEKPNFHQLQTNWKNRQSWKLLQSINRKREKPRKKPIFVPCVGLLLVGWYNCTPFAPLTQYGRNMKGAK